MENDKSIYHLPEENKTVHGPMIAENIRVGDKITLEIKAIDGVLLKEEVDVWRLSPLGLEFVSSANLTDQIKFGTNVDVTMHIHNETINYHGLVVCSVQKGEKRTLIGFRWMTEKPRPNDGIERRESKRWLCGKEYLPSGMFPNPLKFNDFIHFRVNDFSKGGMQIETSMRNKLLTPGMKISATVTYPLIGKAEMRFEIINARVTRRDGKDFLCLGCKLLNLDLHTKSLIGQYLLQFGNLVSIADLEKDGFTVESVNNAVTFSYVRSEEDYKKVLELRKRAWLAAENFKGTEVQDEHFADEYDSRSRILTAFYKGQAVASCRLVFFQENDKLEHEKYLEIPEEVLPRPEELLEITRVVVDPGYRGKDLLYLLFRQATLTCLQAGKRYILGASEEKLFPLYTKMGFRVLKDYSFELKQLNARGYLILVDVHRVISGSDVSPIVWNLMFSQLTRYLSKLDTVELSASTRMKLRLYQTLGPLSKLIAKRMANKPRRRK